MLSAPSHFLRANESNRYPRRLVFLDSEARIEAVAGGESHGFRLAYGELVTVNPKTKADKILSSCVAFTPEQLWGWVDSESVERERTVLVAWNLGYDLRVTRAFTWLPLLGWKLRAVALDNRCCWARWQKGRKSICMIDGISFLPKSLEIIGGELGLAKEPLPKQDDDNTKWLERCIGDVAIMREAFQRMLRYLENNELGTFRLTGAAQSSAAFRHRFYTPKTLLIHKDEDALAAERISAHTGRCEVWKHGAIHKTLFEWDYSLAYATIARDLELPVRLRSRLGRMPLENMQAMKDRYRMLLHVQVSTEKPILPTHHNDRILWPVGRFDSWLWDDEVSLAIAGGAKVRILGGWSYDKAPLLREWAKWILGELNGRSGSLDPTARIMLKAWSRSLIGRFGLRYPLWKEAGEMPDEDLRYTQFIDADDEQRGAYLQIGTDLLEQYGITDSPDACPSIMAAIMSAARCRLWRAMEFIGLENVYYVDTDSILVDSIGSGRMQSLSRKRGHEALRLKKVSGYNHLFAPRCIELEGDRRISGLPKNSEEVGENEYVAEIWQSPAESLRRGNANAVTVSRRTFSPSREDWRRIHLDNGETSPVRLPV